MGENFKHKIGVLLFKIGKFLPFKFDIFLHLFCWFFKIDFLSLAFYA